MSRLRAWLKSCRRLLKPAVRGTTRPPAFRPAVEALGARVVPAVAWTFNAHTGALVIHIDNNSTTGQSVTVGSHDGFAILFVNDVTNAKQQRIAAASAVKSITVYGSALSNHIDLGGVTSRGGFSPALNGHIVVNAGDGDDWVRGSDFNDRLFGQGGNDNIAGHRGNDTIDGGAGSDALDGNDGDDTLSGGTGDDWMWGGAGRDSFDGGPGFDRALDWQRGEHKVNVP